MFPKNPGANPGPGAMPLQPLPAPMPNTNAGGVKHGLFERQYNKPDKTKRSMHSRAGALAGLKKAVK